MGINKNPFLYTLHFKVQGKCYNSSRNRDHSENPKEFYWALFFYHPVFPFDITLSHWSQLLIEKLNNFLAFLYFLFKYIFHFKLIFNFIPFIIIFRFYDLYMQTSFEGVSKPFKAVKGPLCWISEMVLCKEIKQFLSLQRIK